MNNYQVYDEIGTGRYSKVFKGRHKQTVNYYAISSFDKPQLERVKTNVDHLRMLKHKNIIRFHAWYETQNHLWVITEYCIGGNLKKVLSESTKLNETSVRIFGIDLAEGLMYIHTKEVIYGNLRPSNILMDATATMRLYDFRLASTFEASVNPSWIGTPAYMAPELFLKEGRRSMASDLWAFGCVLYEMLAGTPPFNVSSMEELVSDIAEKEYIPIPGFSASFNNLVASLLVKDPLKRATWATVVKSPFWNDLLSLPTTRFPSEPAFEQYKKVRASGGGSSVNGPEFYKQAMVMVQRANQVFNNSDYGNAAGPSPLSETSFADESVPAPQPAVKPAPSASGHAAAASTDTNTGAAAATRTPASKPPVSQPQAPAAATPAATAANHTTATNTTAAATARVHGTPSDAAPPLRPKSSHAATPSTHHGSHHQPTQPSRPATKRSSTTTNTSSSPSTKSSGPTAAAKAQPTAAAAPAAATSSQVRAATASSVTPDGSRTAAQAIAKSEFTVFTSNVKLHTPQDVQAFDSLLIHSSDIHIRPLVMNSRIEPATEVTFDPDMMSFKAYPQDDLMVMLPAELEGFLTKVYTTLSSSRVPTEEKINLVHYLMTICSQSKIVNVIINSSIMTLCARVITSSQPIALRTDTAALMGYFVRHCTFIHGDLAKTKVVSDIVRIYKQEESPLLRRKLLMCIGEFLFYVATQKEQNYTTWGIETEELTLYYQSALADEDDILRHYAVKTIENLASIPNKASALALFANEGTVRALLTVYALPPSANRTDYLRCSAACAALKLAMTTESLIETVFDAPELGLATYVQTEDRKGNRNAQMILSFLCFVLAKSLVAINSPMAALWKDKCRDNLFSQTTLTKAAGQRIIDAMVRNSKPLLSSLLNGHRSYSGATHGKTLLLITLLGTADTRVILDVCQGENMSHLETLVKDKDPYVVSCRIYLTSFLSAYFLDRLYVLSSTDISLLSLDTVKRTLEFIEQLSNRSNFKSRVVFAPDAITYLAECVAKVYAPSSGFAQFETDIDNIADFAAKQCTPKRSNHPAAITLARSYINILDKASPKQRFHALQLITVIIMAILADAANTDMNNSSSEFYKMIESAVSGICKHFPSLLAGTDQIPFYAIRLVCGCGFRYPKLLSPLVDTTFTTKFIQFILQATDNAVPASLRLLTIILKEGAPALSSLVVRKGIHLKALALLAANVGDKQRKVEDDMETYCDFISLLVSKLDGSSSRNAEDGSSSSSHGTATAAFAKNNSIAAVFLPACNMTDETARESAATCVLTLTQTYKDSAASLLSEDGLTVLAATLTDAGKNKQTAVIFPLVDSLKVALKSTPNSSKAAASLPGSGAVVEALQSIVSNPSSNSEVVRQCNDAIPLLQSENGRKRN